MPSTTPLTAQPLPADEARALADYVLERLAAGLAENEGHTGNTLASAQLGDVSIALQRLIGAVAGEAYELRLTAMLNLADRYRFGDSARAIAQARVLAKADADAAHLTRVAA